MVHWIRAGEGVVDFAPVQSGAGEPYGLHADRPMGALHLVEINGEMRRGAEAVFRMMDRCSSRIGMAAWWLYQRSRLFRVLSDRGYGLVSARRAALSRRVCRIPNAPEIP